MDDYLKYNMFFEDPNPDNDSEDDPDDSAAGSSDSSDLHYSAKKSESRPSPVPPAQKESSDTGCMLLVLAGFVWLLYMRLKLAS